MVEGEVTRRLAAIVAADVAGYSRLVSEDEEGTFAALRTHRADFIDPNISAHHGRIANTAGDSILIEFPSVVEALRCCIEIQRSMAERNTDIAENKRIEFRVGINLGDVIEQDGDLLGDGVNVAARLEGLAHPGGICLSRAARDQVRDRMDINLEDLGEVEVKNIARPVRVFRVLAVGEKASTSKRAPWQKFAAMAFLVFVLAAGGIAWWWQQLPDFEPVDPTKMAYALPEKPSIAVLPFDNLSGSKDQEFLADGLTETIISALSTIPEMFVIARNSTFTYKGKPVKVQQVAEELGVRYVLEGSIQRDGDRLRVTAQLVDAVSGHHLWAERYDRQSADIFAVQDDITLQIVSALHLELTEGERARFDMGSTKNLRAWSLYIKGITLFRRFTQKDNQNARRLFQEAVDLDPRYVGAWNMLGWTHSMDARRRWSKSYSESIRLSELAIEKVFKIAPNGSLGYALRGMNYLLQGKHKQAIAEQRKAVELNPSIADRYAVLAISTYYAGSFRETVALTKQAMRLHPHHPSWYFFRIGVAHMMLGEHEEAIDALKARYNENPDYYRNKIALALGYSMAGRIEEAKQLVSEALAAKPSYSLVEAAASHRFKDPKHLDRVLNALRQAGVPEHPPLKLPDKPSIAILAFDNLSGSSEQDYIADGLSENIISVLSKVPEIFVIARNSSFTYKGKAVKVQQIAKDLGVRFILEGSIQKAGNRLRVTAQLIDAVDDRHLWAERYDRKITDLFAIQDEITLQIASSLRGKLAAGETARLDRHQTKNLRAWELTVKAATYYQRYSKSDNATARKLLKQSLELDANYIGAQVLLGWAHFIDARWKFSESRPESLRLAKQSVEKAMSLDPDDSGAHALLGGIYLLEGKHDEAIAEAEKAIDLAPSNSTNYAVLAIYKYYAGAFKETVALTKKAMRLHPYHPAWYSYRIGVAYMMLGEHDDAILALKKNLASNPASSGKMITLATAYSMAGQIEEARKLVTKALAAQPGYKLKNSLAGHRFKDPKNLNRIREALVKAGVPE
jgi:adenylate cyclase